MGTNYVFITGGVVSSLGKGITAASLGRLLKARGLKVSLQKLDPYMNINSGKLSPLQHGEVFVTDDGAETDLDIGHYERFTDERFSRSSNYTAGSIYDAVLKKERAGIYPGLTVQVIPHVTNEIKARIKTAAKGQDVAITEIGGTIGDMESLAFVEAIRQLRLEDSNNRCVYIHVTLVPYLDKVGELKTKPTQHSVKELRSLGIQPDIIVCRAQVPLGTQLKEKVALFCNVNKDSVVENVDSKLLYEVPVQLHEQNLDGLVCQKLGITCGEPNLSEWYAMLEKYRTPKQKLKVALVGTYCELRDAYLSSSEALMHAGIENDAKVEIDWIQTKNIDTMEKTHAALSKADAVFLPGAYDETCEIGHINAVRYARENCVPLLATGGGFCFCASEFMQNVLKTDMPLFETKYIMPKLGSAEIKLSDGSLLMDCYRADTVYERHRHSDVLCDQAARSLEAKGLRQAALSNGNTEGLELVGHPFFIAVQYHPEFSSRPNNAHRLFAKFISAALGNRAK